VMFLFFARAKTEEDAQADAPMPVEQPA
jgi:hypothetical protein